MGSYQIIVRGTPDRIELLAGGVHENGKKQKSARKGRKEWLSDLLIFYGRSKMKMKAKQN